MLAVTAVLMASHVAPIARSGAEVERGLVGVWQLVEMHKGGQKLTKEQLPPARACFTGREYQTADNVLPIAGSYRVDTTKRPHMILFTAYNGPGRNTAEAMTFELTDDVLRLTHRLDGHEEHTAVFQRVTP